MTKRSHEITNHKVKPGTKDIYDEHVSLRDKWQGTDGAYIFDIDQHPSFCKGGPLVPCLITHGTIVSEDKIMTSTEHLLAMGEPINKDDVNIDTDL